MQKIIFVLAAFFLILLVLFLFSMQGKPKTSTNEALSDTKQENVTDPTTNTRTMKINTDKSTITWSAKKLVGQTNHTGTVQIKNGSINLESGAISEGKIIVSMKTIENEDIQNQAMKGKLVSHLKSEDFFAVENFPETTLTITEADEEVGPENTHMLTGDLTIKGITNQISFPAKILIAENIATADAEFSINRIDWGIKFGSNSFFDNLGDQAIDDMMNFKIHIEAQ